MEERTPKCRSCFASGSGATEQRYQGAALRAKVTTQPCSGTEGRRGNRRSSPGAETRPGGQGSRTAPKGAPAEQIGQMCPSGTGCVGAESGSITEIS